MTKKLIILTLAATIITQSVYAIEDNKKSFFDFFKKHKNQKQTKVLNEQNDIVKLPKFKRKISKVEDIKLPPVRQGKRPPVESMSVMTIDDCVNYALSHNPNLIVTSQRIQALKAGIGIQRANYAPRLTGRVNYNHTDINTNRQDTNNSSLGFNVGIADTIWDFGRTTAKINMTKYNTMSAVYDHEFEVLRVIYDVKINYYKVLQALANLDIFEQNVRIQTLNFERTKAMFDEGLKSKIDVVNAEVNLTDAKIQLVECVNRLESAIISLKNSMYFQEDVEFVVQNTENFAFLKPDYKTRIESITTIKPPSDEIKRTPDGMILLSSGIEHKDIIQNFEFKPLVITKKEAVEEALSNRPDLKANDMLTQVQEESLRAIKKEYMPEITGEVTWGYTKTDHNYNSPLQLGASMGLGSINPYRIHYQIEEGENYLDIAYHNLNIAKSDIFWEVQKNYVDMRRLEKEIPLMSLKVKATLENFELADGRYSVGLNNYIELQDALTNYNNSQFNFVEAVFEYNVARETLLKSMGVK